MGNQKSGDEYLPVAALKFKFLLLQRLSPTGIWMVERAFYDRKFGKLVVYRVRSWQ